MSMTKGAMRSASLLAFCLLLGVYGCKRKPEVAGRNAIENEDVVVEKHDTVGDVGHAEWVEKKTVAETSVVRLHPAARERQYVLESLDALAAGEEEREVLEWMRDPKKGPAVLERVAKAGAKGHMWLRKALKCFDKNARVQACLVYGNLRRPLSKEDIAALCDAMLLDPDPDVRATAAKVFVTIKAKDAVPALLRSLADDPYAPARANAAWALGQIGGPGVVAQLRRALKDEDTWVRLRAVTALGRLRASEARDDIRKMLEDPNSMVRERANEVLKSLGGR